MLASFSRIIKFNCQKLCLKRVEIIIITSSVRAGMWMIQNTFAVIESDWALSGGFNSFMKSISYKRQSNLLGHFLSTVKFSVMEGLSRPCYCLMCFPIEDLELECSMMH